MFKKKLEQMPFLKEEHPYYKVLLFLYIKMWDKLIYKFSKENNWLNIFLKLAQNLNFSRLSCISQYST